MNNLWDKVNIAITQGSNKVDKNDYYHFRGRYVTIVAKNGVRYFVYAFPDAHNFRKYTICVIRSKNGNTINEKWYYNQKRSTNLSIAGDLVQYAKRLFANRRIDCDYMSVFVLDGDKTYN
jgi:hypothetical protein